jgi:hypothetical protein
MEEKEFEEADAVLKLAAPTFSEDPLKLAYNGEGAPPALYWYQGILYQHRRVSITTPISHTTEVSSCWVQLPHERH